MVHSTPFRVFMYGHWDDHAVDEIFLSNIQSCSLQKGNTLHHTDLRWLEGKNDLTWLDLNNYVTWLDLKKKAMTWLATLVLLTWLDLWLEQGCLITTLPYSHSAKQHMERDWEIALDRQSLFGTFITNVVHKIHLANIFKHCKSKCITKNLEMFQTRNSIISWWWKERYERAL